MNNKIEQWEPFFNPFDLIEVGKDALSKAIVAVLEKGSAYKKMQVGRRKVPTIEALGKEMSKLYLAQADMERAIQAGTSKGK